MNKKYIPRLLDDTSYLSQVGPKQRNTTGTKRANSSHHRVTKRIPIFDHSHNSHNYGKKLSRQYGGELLSERMVINYDFCGCEDKMSTCAIIQTNFLAEIPRKQLRSSYTAQYQRNMKAQNLKDSRYKLSLLSTLPRWYPQLLYPQLKNILQVIGQSLSIPEFECLAAIEYHAKVQYITYYLYQDLKKAYNNKQQFYNLAERELAKQGTSFRKLKYQYNETSDMAAQLEQFINNYYDSIGANLVPLQYYAKFLAAVYVVGSRVFVKMLVNFVVLRQEELKRGFRLLRAREVEGYRNYMREFNFQEFILQAQ